MAHDADIIQKESIKQREHESALMFSLRKILSQNEEILRKLDELKETKNV